VLAVLKLIKNNVIKRTVLAHEEDNPGQVIYTRISESHTYTKKVHTTNVYLSNPVSPTSIAMFHVP